MILGKFFRDKDGQMVVWLAASLVTLILFAALSIDMAMIYMTKARLSNAVDAAVLTAAKNASLGETTAKTLGSDIFYANLGTACSSSGVTCTWTYCPGDASCPATGPITATLYATTPWNTTFMAYLPSAGSWTPALWTLGDTGQATRSTLIMTIVLDRSGSMGSDGGMTALKSAVPQFVSDFSEGTDYLGLVSFASHSSIDVQIETQTFQTDIDNAVSAMNANGGTFGGGAGSGTIYSTTNGPPLNMADAQNNSVNLSATVPKVKVVVYFTDGLMNTLQDQFTCVGQSNPTLVNYGGADPDNPGEGAPYPPEAVYSQSPTAESVYTCYDPTSDPDHGNYNGCTTTYLPMYNNSAQACTYGGNQLVFPSEEYPSQSPLAMNRWNVTNETKYRAKYTANQMRMETPVPTYIFTIGLGTDVSGDPCTEAFLATLANDPNAANYTGGANCDSGAGVYTSTEPTGLFVIVPDCPGTQCTEELNQAFQEIASKVLLRLSQ